MPPLSRHSGLRGAIGAIALAACGAIPRGQPL
jgi:hypothetical protein